MKASLRHSNEMIDPIRESDLHGPLHFRRSELYSLGYRARSLSLFPRPQERKRPACQREIYGFGSGRRDSWGPTRPD